MPVVNGSVEDPEGCWVVEEREGRGRCLVAGSRGFAPGDTVMRSSCVAAVLHFDRIGRRCSYCFTNKTKAKTCSKCHLIAYCSRACQCADWPMHAHECKHLAAAIDAYGAWAESNARSASEQLLETVLGMFTLTRAQGNHGDASLSIDGSLTDMLLAARTLWAHRDAPNPEVMAMALPPNHTSPRASASSRHATSLGHFMSTHPAVKMLLPPQTSTNAVHELLARFAANNFGILDDLQVCLGAGTYPRGALLNHSCAPNCVLVYEGTAQVVRCVVAIPPGGECCHSYTDLCAPTSQRRAALEKHYGFVCDCSRCERGLTSRRTSENASAEGVQDINVDEALSATRSSTQDAAARASKDKQEETAALKEAAHLEAAAAQYQATDDTENEQASLARCLALREKHLGPLHVDLYRTRGLMLSACLLGGDLEGALRNCRGLVSFLEACLAHVPNHPLLALQLFTLADLEDASANSDNEAFKKGESAAAAISKEAEGAGTGGVVNASGGKVRARALLARALSMLEITHGAQADLCVAARARLAEDGDTRV